MVDTCGRSTVDCENGTEDELGVILESPLPDSQLARVQLRQRWELASILNFLNVFEPVLGIKYKISAEEIEMALIVPNESLSQLHVALLKGIPPASKILNNSYGWVTVLCKKLKVWWPWVAEGECPLNPAKGEEIHTYKAADPIVRLLLLKALCEIRADQDDILAHVNDSLKNGTALSTFRKDKFGGDGCGISYWYDGNETIGHRLYKEILKVECKPKVKGMGNMLGVNFQWETLATNLEEFRAFAVSFGEAKWESSVCKAVQADIIPSLEKIQKKKERVLKRQRRQDMIPNGFVKSAFTRSCRNRGPVNYRFDDYDKAIREAIQVTNNKKTAKEQRYGKRYSEHNTINGSVNEIASASCSSEDEPAKSDTEKDQDQGSDFADCTSDEHDGEKVANPRKDANIAKHLKGDNNSTLHSQAQESMLDLDHRDKDPHCNRLAENEGYTTNCRASLSTKDRLMESTILTATEDEVVPDSEDEMLLNL
ncbi:unnamed protein product [Cuscuta campestris]|uniref:DDT domain-containing protein n=1 Tax=Cuscuta campestris TaxID=132261 RepID=A0A484K382_9ASTE|nr:unnamed protein product [Cuscuta campestris]